VRTVVPCPDCGAPVPIPMVQIVKGDGADVSEIFCRNCMWTGGDEIFKSGRGKALVVWGGEEIVADLRHPYVFVPVTDAASLNARINALTNGGTIWLEQGNYAAAGDLTITKSNVGIWGVGRDSTILPGSVTISGGNVSLQDMWVYANGKSYGIKMYGGGVAGVPRNELRRVRVGGNSDAGGRAPSGDGPQVGLWLDGSILTVADHCLFAFCNTGSGLYVNTTNGTYSTNCNVFRSCTFNGNATYGVEITEGGDGVSGMLLHSFVGGNMEDNGSGEVIVDGAIGIRLQDIDFETSKTISTTLNLEAANVTVENCHATTVLSGAVTRFFLINAGRTVVRGCRISGNFTSPDIGAVLDNSSFFSAYDNEWWGPLGTAGNVTITPRWINNRANQQGYSA